VTFQVKTSGIATAQLRRDRREPPGYLFALCVPAAWIFLLGMRRRRRLLCWVGLLLCSVCLVNCGGGYKPPATSKAAETPAGNYQVVIVSQPANTTNNSGFVQTSLIVPLPVSQTL